MLTLITFRPYGYKKRVHFNINIVCVSSVPKLMSFLLSLFILFVFLLGLDLNMDDGAFALTFKP